MRTNTRNRLIATGVLVVSLVCSGALSTAIAASIGRHELRYTTRAEDGDPPEIAIGIAMGAFRGLFVNMLWLRANELKEQGKFHEAIELSRAITQLQPRFPRVWAFHAWNMAYNISVATQTPEERYQWVMAGIRLLRDEGLKANPDDLLLHKELAWIYLHKIGGYTDDSNQYYKRRVAAEWTDVLGPPPGPGEWKSRSRDDVIEAYAAKLRAIADAPDSESGLAELNPKAPELLRAVRRIFDDDNINILRRVALLTEADRTGRGQVIRDRLGDRGQQFIELWDDAQYRDAWPVVTAFLRRRVLIDDYHMEPRRMLRYTERFGPIDWRLPAAHSLYWSTRGVEVGRVDVDPHNSDHYDFTNANRVSVQSVQELFRFGELYFNYVDYAIGLNALYQTMPNPYFVETYGDIIYEIVLWEGERDDVFVSDRRATKPFATGYENFLKDAITFFYRRGDRAAAEKWYNRLLTWDDQNVNTFAQYEVQDLDTFVEQQLFERFDSPQVAVQQINGAIQNAMFNGLLRGDTETFDRGMEFAQKAHLYFTTKQVRDVVASNDLARMGYVQRSFPDTAGAVYATTLTQLPPVEAELLYTYAPEWLRRYGYDILVERFGEAREQIEAITGKPFEIVFPEPAGMEQFRATQQQRRQREAEQRGVQGIEEG